MITVNDDVGKIFNDVLHEISQNIRHMMEELWLNWSHLGVDDSTKINNITKLVQIEKELHRDVISETRQKLKIMQGQVDKLKEETEELSRCLSVDITILDFKEDMMLVEYKRELEEQIIGYREQMEQRRMKMDRLLEWQRDLTDKLGVTIQDLQEVPLPSENELDKLKDHLEVLQAERDKRVEIFLNTQVEIKDIMDKLQIKPQNKFEQLVVTSLSVEFKVTDLNMDRLAKLRQDLQEKYEQTNNRVLELRERLSKLWECLEEDRIYCDNFLQAHPGCHPQTEMAIKEEIKRCDLIKRQKISVFVANVRTKIKLMWDNVKYSTQEREEFVHYYQDIFTEDTLTLHELYLDKLTKFYNENKHIFELVVTRRELWLKMHELEARASEPGRYHNRGGQLLREEKERKAIASNLPKIEAQIRDLVMEYEDKTGTIFTVDGKPLLQLMQDEWQLRNDEREHKRSARKQALTPNTPSFRLATSPLGKRNRTAAGLAATAERNRPPSKRQLITSSATKAVTTIASNLSAFKRSAVSTVKRRISGRLAARGNVESRSEHVKRKIDYAGEGKKTPKVNGSILKHKRTSHGRRRSNGRRSMTANRSATSQEDTKNTNRDPLMETTLLTTYTDFKDGINEKQISRSSMAKGYEGNIPAIVYTTENAKETPKKTSRAHPTALTPKVGKENIQQVNPTMTPKSNLLYTPTRLTRSALKLNNDGFATPRAPLSANKVNLQRQNTATNMHLKTTPNNMSRSKSQTHLVRVKNLPPLMRFRRAVDEDLSDIQAIVDSKYTEPLFGDVDIGSLIELSTLSICMIDKNNEVIGFMALCDHPNVPGVDPSDWEMWIRNMFQKYYLARNTLFIHFMYCIDTVKDVFLEQALVSVFTNDVYILQLVLVMPPKCPKDCLARYMTRLKNMNKVQPNRQDSCESQIYLYAALRKDFCPQLQIRRAVEEDNDEIVDILGQICPRLQELYGDYYISEIIGRHPEMTRQIIVAECHDQVVGVMCLNSDVNYEMLEETYVLEPYYGLRKATAFDKEAKERSNQVLKTFGEPIMLGKWGPFSTIKRDKISNEETSVTNQGKTSTRPTIGASKSKVLFQTEEVQTSTYDYDSRPSVRPDRSTMNLIFAEQSLIDLNLGEDTFDYEIINIEKQLLTVPDALSYEFLLPSSSVNATEFSETCVGRKTGKRRSSILKPAKFDGDKKKFSGSPNAFIIELFGMREDVDDVHAFELLEGAFETMQQFDYCIIRTPCKDKSFYLLQHFCFVPTKSNMESKYALYVAHRCSVASKLRVREAEVTDIPQITKLLHHQKCQDAVWVVENTVSRNNVLKCYVFLNSVTMIGVGILEPSEDLNYLETHLNIETYHMHKYHKKENPNGCFAMLNAVLIYPVFEPHFRFFARDMMRLSGSTTLMFLTVYRNKWLTHKANSMVGTMVPLLPRKSEISFTFSELNEVRRTSNTLVFSAWLLSKKITSVQRLNVDTRIVIVGASRTAMAILNTLLFSDSSTYILFTNITLVSSAGLPYSRHTNHYAKMMFNYYKSDSEKYLKSVPYTYYVNVVKGIMVEINKKEKYIQLSNGGKCYYDLLILLFGKQYQHPYYMLDTSTGNLGCNNGGYKRHDIPGVETPIVCREKTPNNLFIINSVADANRALRLINTIDQDEYNDRGKIIVYGSTINAYCCLATLVEMKIPGEDIIFVEPFPDENPRKTRVPLFCNVYVDKKVQEVIQKLNITVYRSFYFHSWTLNSEDYITHVDFYSQSKVMRLQCSAFFYYGKRVVNEQAFIALNKSGIVYDGGILIDHEFRTMDPSIYAAGPVTRYHRRYFADGKVQKHYDAYEIGSKLGTQIRNQLDPLFPEKRNTSHGVRRSMKIVSFDTPSIKENATTRDREEETENDLRVPKFKSPLVTHCVLPGSLKYLDVRPPGRKIPHHYLQSLHYNGYVLETFKGGYFKLHLTKDFKVDGITCLTTELRSLENFKYIYGLPSAVLNNVYLRYMTKRLDSFYDFFELPWASFLYHDHRDDLIAMVKELLPKGQRHGDTLEEVLHRIAEDMSPSLETLLQMRSRFENSLHFEAIIDYVIQWVTDNESTLPMYLNPHQQTTLSHDPNMKHTFKKRKQTFLKMFSKMI